MRNAKCGMRNAECEMGIRMRASRFRRDMLRNFTARWRTKERSMTVSVVQAKDVVWRVDEGAAPISFTLETSVLPYSSWLCERP
jgi:hypothetical protein